MDGEGEAAAAAAAPARAAADAGRLRISGRRGRENVLPSISFSSLVSRCFPLEDDLPYDSFFSPWFSSRCDNVHARLATRFSFFRLIPTSLTIRFSFSHVRGSDRPDRSDRSDRSLWDDFSVPGELDVSTR